MAISATFQNAFGASRKWTIWDTGIDPSAPAVIFDGYLDVDVATAALSLQDLGAGQGTAQYKRSDGPVIALGVSDGQNVSMS